MPDYIEIDDPRAAQFEPEDINKRRMMTLEEYMADGDLVQKYLDVGLYPYYFDGETNSIADIEELPEGMRMSEMSPKTLVLWVDPQGHSEDAASAVDAQLRELGL